MTAIHIVLLVLALLLLGYLLAAMLEPEIFS